MPITSDGNPYTPMDGDYTVSGAIAVGSGETAANIPFLAVIQAGSQGYTEAQMDEATQNLVDLIAGTEGFTSASGIKTTPVGFIVTPDEE